MDQFDVSPLTKTGYQPASVPNLEIPLTISGTTWTAHQVEDPDIPGVVYQVFTEDMGSQLRIGLWAPDGFTRGEIRCVSASGLQLDCTMDADLVNLDSYIGRIKHNLLTNIDDLPVPSEHYKVVPADQVTECLQEIVETSQMHDHPMIVQIMQYYYQADLGSNQSFGQLTFEEFLDANSDMILRVASDILKFPREDQTYASLVEHNSLGLDYNALRVVARFVCTSDFEEILSNLSED